MNSADPLSSYGSVNAALPATQLDRNLILQQERAICQANFAAPPLANIASRLQPATTNQRRHAHIDYSGNFTRVLAEIIA
jgi:hypothetical protein